MKSIKIKLLLFAFLISCFLNSYAQVFSAGYNLSSYFDINPDTLLNYYCAPGIGNSSESYFFDVNGDLQNDFEIQASCSFSLGGSGERIIIRSLNPNSCMRYERIDSVYNSQANSWGFTKVAKPLQYSDSINSQISKWDSTYLYLNATSSSMGGWYLNITDWVSSHDEFIGIKYQKPTDTIYGWIRVNSPIRNKCYIKDYSFGEASSSIKNFDIFKEITIYPNPVKDKIYITNTNSCAIEVRLFDIIGKQISEAILSKSPETEIDVSGLCEGIYFLSVKTSEGNLTKKIIVQR